MAKVRGKAGRFVEDESVRKSRQFFLLILVAVVVLVGAGSFFLGLTYSGRQHLWASVAILTFGLVAVLIYKRFVDTKLVSLERDSITYRKGAVGEALIAGILKCLSDDYVVLNDLRTEFGNIDHSVVGPTGVFVIDTKNWKGLVDSDGKGELLLNGKPTDKDEVKKLVSTCAETRKKIKTLCGHEPYIHAVLAFTSAHVKARWGTVKNADCVTDETLIAYIENNKGRVKLTKEQIDAISRAFEMLAGMDKGFDAAAANDAQ